MKTGTSSIVVGIILTVLFGLGTLRNLVVLPMTLMVYGPSGYVLGSFLGAAVAVLFLLLAIRLLRRGLAQRQALQRMKASPAPTFLR